MLVGTLPVTNVSRKYISAAAAAEKKTNQQPQGSLKMDFLTETLYLGHILADGTDRQ